MGAAQCATEGCRCCKDGDSNDEKLILVQGEMSALAAENDFGPAMSPGKRKSDDDQTSSTCTPTSPLAEEVKFNARSNRGHEAALDTTQLGVVRFEFSFDGESKEVSFTRRPFGFSFTRQIPPIVSRITPGGQAEIHGIKVGWIITKMADTPVHTMTVQDLVTHIRAMGNVLRKEEAPPLELQFEITGERKVVTFTKTPLGLTFQEKDDLGHLGLAVATVVTPSEASRAGVLPGWEVTRVGNHCVTEMKDSSDVLWLLKDLASMLPPR